MRIFGVWPKTWPYPLVPFSTKIMPLCTFMASALLSSFTEASAPPWSALISPWKSFPLFDESYFTITLVPGLSTGYVYFVSRYLCFSISECDLAIVLQIFHGSCGSVTVSKSCLWPKNK